MDLTHRFVETWGDWDAQVHDAREATAFLRSAKDETLLELLAGESDQPRNHERDIISTEIANRLTRRSVELPGGATDVYHAARVAYEAAAKSQIAILTAGGLLKAHGDDELGTSIAGAAIVTLDTTRAAMDAARKHLADLQAALAQSRVAERLIEDAAHAALEAAIKAEQGAAKVAQLGRVREAAAARQAAFELHQAADEATRILRER